MLYDHTDNQSVHFIPYFNNKIPTIHKQHWTTFIQRLLKELESKAKAELGVSDIRYVVDYGLRSSYTVAQWKKAKCYQNHLRFNNYLFNQIDDFSIIKEVVVHEFSHMLAYNIYGLNIDEHGNEWRLIMRRMGGKDLFPNNKIFKSYRFKPSDKEARCNCCQSFFISSQMAYNIQTLGYVYVCPDCNSKIKLKERK